MNKIDAIYRRTTASVAVTALIAAVGLFMLNDDQFFGIAVIIGITAFACYCLRHPVLKTFAFTVWVAVFVAVAMYYPPAFGVWFGFDLQYLIVPLIQIIMFGMGTTLSLEDFKRVLVMPYPVFIGVLLQYGVMPAAGFGIALLFQFEPEIAAGIILIGSCSGGVASNLMAYLAGGNVALSVTMTACSTMLSPVLTPFLMERLAGRFVLIDFYEMMLSILNMIIVPIVAGIIANKILYSKADRLNRIKELLAISIGSIVVAGIILLMDAQWFGALRALQNGLCIGLVLIGVIALLKLFVNLLLKVTDNWMDKVLPVISMFGICYIIGIIVSRSADELLVVGMLLICASILHNFIGYVTGYWCTKSIRLEERTCRTVAFEVGMQNGGMATGLAMTVLKSAGAALAPAIFGVWMNISGSLLANWWRRKSVLSGAGYPESRSTQ